MHCGRLLPRSWVKCLTDKVPMKTSSLAVVDCPRGMRGGFALRACCFLVLLSSFTVGVVLAQSAPTEPSKPVPATPQESAANVPELSTQEEIQTFQVKVNLVDMRVVVRDAQGKPVGNLKQDDFLLFDDNKPQTITKFSVLNLGTSDAPAAGATSVDAQGTESPAESLKVKAPIHRIAYLFDDVNSTANDLVQARNAVEKRVSTIQPGESLAIFTISGQGTQDFTSDQDRLRAALAQLKARPPSVGLVGDCPPIDYYIANQVAANHDPQPLRWFCRKSLAACMTATPILRYLRYRRRQRARRLIAFFVPVRHNCRSLCIRWAT